MVPALLDTSSRGGSIILFTICGPFVLPHLQGPATTVTLPVFAVSSKEPTAKDVYRLAAVSKRPCPGLLVQTRTALAVRGRDLLCRAERAAAAAASTALRSKQTPRPRNGRSGCSVSRLPAYRDGRITLLGSGDSRVRRGPGGTGCTWYSR